MQQQKRNKVCISSVPVTRTANIAGWALEPSQTRAPALLRTLTATADTPKPHTHKQTYTDTYPDTRTYCIHSVNLAKTAPYAQYASWTKWWISLFEAVKSLQKLWRQYFGSEVLKSSVWLIGEPQFSWHIERRTGYISKVICHQSPMGEYLSQQILIRVLKLSGVWTPGKRLFIHPWSSAFGVSCDQISWKPRDAVIYMCWPMPPAACEQLEIWLLPVLASCTIADMHNIQLPVLLQICWIGSWAQ